MEGDGKADKSGSIEISSGMVARRCTQEAREMGKIKREKRSQKKYFTRIERTASGPFCAHTNTSGQMEISQGSCRHAALAALEVREATGTCVLDLRGNYQLDRNGKKINLIFSFSF